MKFFKKVKIRAVSLLLVFTMVLGVFFQPMTAFAASSYDYPAFENLVPEGHYWFLGMYNGTIRLYVSPVRFLVGNYTGYGEAVGVAVDSKYELTSLSAVGVKSYLIEDGKWIERTLNPWDIFCCVSPRSYLTYIGCSNDIKRASDNYIIYRAQELTSASTGGGIYFTDYTEVNSLTERIKNIAQGMIGGFLSMLSDPLEAIGNVLQYVYNGVISVRDSVVSGLKSVGEHLLDLKAYWEKFAKDLWADLTDNTMTIKEKITAIKDDLLKPLKDTKDNLVIMKNRFLEFIDGFKTGVIDQIKSMVNYVVTIKDNLLNLGSTLANALSGAVFGAISSAFENIPILAEIRDNVASFVTGVLNLPQLVANKFQELFTLLFVPGPDYFDNIKVKFQEKFTFVQSIKNVATIIYEFFRDTDFTKPPVITVHLSQAKGSLNFGESAKILDMSWYAPYKPSVDVIISSIMLVAFGFRMYFRLHTVITGATAGANIVSSVHGGSEE